MADTEIIRRNERLKAFTGQLYNLGAALFAGAAVKVYADARLSAQATLWILGSAALIWVGHGLLGLIEDEG